MTDRALNPSIGDDATRGLAAELEAAELATAGTLGTPDVFGQPMSTVQDLSMARVLTLLAAICLSTSLHVPFSNLF